MRETNSTLFLDAKIITMEKRGIIESGWVKVDNGRIEALGEGHPPKNIEADVIYSLDGKWLLPGFVQAHVHLCQVLIRGMAEDLELIDWLKERIWPFEAAHTETTLRASARLGIAELLKSGTTAIADMGTVHHTHVLFETAAEMGIRAAIGKAMMDAGDGVPEGLFQSGELALRESVELAEQYNGYANGRLLYIFYPRFLLSVSEQTFIDTVKEARRLGCRMHTHTSEHRNEAEAVMSATGMESIEFLNKTGFLGEDVVLVHAIHLSEREFELIRSTNTNVVHCPSANFKLGSGIANTPAMLDAGMNVALGADGSPCNNNLSIFKEMRLAGLMQSMSKHPGALPAKQIVEMATMGGARALGLETEIGSIASGKQADLVVLDPFMVHSYSPNADPFTVIVYSMDDRNVESVWVAGRELIRYGKLVDADEDDILLEARSAIEDMIERV